MQGIKLVVGLGNPGPQYSRNRHNIGFQCVDLFAQRHGLRIDKMQQRALTGSGTLTCGGRRVKVLLARPLTFMNKVGESVAPLARYYQVQPEEMIVIHDDLDLPAARLRLRADGSSGGQNGVKSIIERLGSPGFARARIGIGRPPGRMDPADYVLQNFTAEEEELYAPLRLRVCDAVECWLAEGIESAMNRFNAA